MNTNSVQNDSLPNLFILGAAKAGTTTLFNLLKQHPQVFRSFDKEPMFFSRDDFYERGIDWYAEKFFKNSQEFPIRVEASPHYLYWASKVSPRIRQAYISDLPKFIVILRSPIERAYSWYWNMASEGHETLPFWDALQEEDDRLAEKWDELSVSGSMKFGYFHGGCYANQLKHFFQDFPKDRFLILFYKDLALEQKVTMQKVFDFLHIDPNVTVNLTYSNRSAMPYFRSLHKFIRQPSGVKNFLKSFLPAVFLHRLKKSALRMNRKRFEYPEMEVRAQLFLQEKYSKELEELSLLLERDLSNWSMCNGR